VWQWRRWGFENWTAITKWRIHDPISPDANWEHSLKWMWKSSWLNPIKPYEWVWKLLGSLCGYSTWNQAVLPNKQDGEFVNLQAIEQQFWAQRIHLQVDSKTNREYACLLNRIHSNGLTFSSISNYWLGLPLIGFVFGCLSQESREKSTVSKVAFYTAGS